MKLLHYTNTKLSTLLLALIGVWGVFFFFAIHYEIRDETDDMLRSYRDIFIKKALQNPKQPGNDDRSENNKDYMLNNDESFLVLVICIFHRLEGRLVVVEAEALCHLLNTQVLQVHFLHFLHPSIILKYMPTPKAEKK